MTGTEKMLPNDVAKFVKEHEEGTLVRPSESGHVIAALALKATKELSGKFVSWDSEECSEFWDTK